MGTTQPTIEEPQTDDRPLILITLFGGGWHREMQRICERFPADRYRYAYAYGYLDDVHGAADLPMPNPGPRYPIRFLGPTRKSTGHRLLNARHFAAAIRESFKLVRKIRPDVIIGLGAASTTALFLAGRLYGARCIFIESLTRVDDLSLTGRILYHTRLSHALYVQWPTLVEKRPRCRYAGAVL